jgi:preprotein translocase subunit SecA
MIGRLPNLWASMGLLRRGESPPVDRTPAALQHAAGSLPGWSAAHHQAWRRSLDEAICASTPEIQRGAWNCRSRLRVTDLATPLGASALGLAAGALHRVLGWRAHDEQGLAAWLMLQGHLAEMATGEGKTLASGLAAATAAMAGLSVHVMTANDYLVQRDADTLRPFFDLLGLKSAAIVTATPREERFKIYRQAIVYVTAREVVFDHLKDHMAQEGERDPRVLRARAMAADVTGGAAAPAPDSEGQPVVPHLQQALIDEADSILLDEASVPFIMSVPGQAPEPTVLEAARQLARSLGPGDVVLNRSSRAAHLRSSGLRLITDVVAPHSPLWPPRRAVEMVRAALVADRLLQRELDYTLRDDAVALIDETTGRLAEGRQWNHPLQAMVELKEGLQPSAPLRTAARITYQRFFPRYERLGGMSGTLKESAAELRTLYHCRVLPVPRARPSKAQWLGRTFYASSEAKWQACVRRAREESVVGRPVLIGTESVDASHRVSMALTAAGLEHQVLNAVQDADEAEQIARAGQAGRITVTTNMAGRGTDIRLDDRARACGGLHVILALANRSRRIDRQLAGRSARQGDPGSAEALIGLEDSMLTQFLPIRLRAMIKRLANSHGELPNTVTGVLVLVAQRLSEWRDRMHRRELRLSEEQLGRQLGFSGRPE